MLSTAEELEAKQRTEEQIKARVKKLGLSTATPASPKETDDEAGDEKAEADRAASGQEGNMGGGEEDPGSAIPALRVRKLKRKNQAEAESDDESEGLFSSVEVCVFRAPSVPELFCRTSTPSGAARVE